MKSLFCGLWFIAYCKKSCSCSLTVFLYCSFSQRSPAAGFKSTLQSTVKSPTQGRSWSTVLFKPSPQWLKVTSSWIGLQTPAIRKILINGAWLQMNSLDHCVSIIHNLLVNLFVASTPDVIRQTTNKIWYLICTIGCSIADCLSVIHCSICTVLK